MPGVGRYLAVGVVALVVVAVVVAYLMASGSGNGKTTANEHSASGGLSTSHSSSSSTTSSTGAQGGTQPSTTSSAPSASTSTPISQSETPTQPAPGLPGQPALPPTTGVEVVVTSSTWIADSESIQIVAAVTGVATQSGNCTATAVLGGDSATASVVALFDGRGTSCGTITIPMQGKLAGNWQVTVAFTYDSGSASSAPTTVKVG